MSSEGLDMEQVYSQGRHMQAFLAMQRIYKARIKHIRSQEGSLRALDFGTGHDSVSRALIESELQPGDSLALYDPSANIAPPLKQSRIIGRNEAFGYVPGGINLVSIAFVLCSLERDKAVHTLLQLRDAHPEAEFLIVDYMLKGREQLADLLKSNAEMLWRKSVGNAEFVRTRTRFDVDALCDVLAESGMPCTRSEVRPLDDYGMRASVVVRPAQEFFVAY